MHKWSHPDDVMHPPVKSYVKCYDPIFHTVALLLCSGTCQTLESRSCMMTFTNFTRNTLRHLLALRGLCCDVLQIPNFCAGQQPALLCTLRRLVALGCQQMLSLNGVNAADKSMKETPPHCRLFVLSGPRSWPCSDTCCGTDRITSYGPVIDAACFLFWREGWQPEPRGAWRIVSVVQGSWHFASSKEGWGMCVCVCVCVHVWNL